MQNGNECLHNFVTSKYGLDFNHFMNYFPNKISIYPRKEKSHRYLEVKMGPSQPQQHYCVNFFGISI